MFKIYSRLLMLVCMIPARCLVFASRFTAPPGCVPLNMAKRIVVPPTLEERVAALEVLAFGKPPKPAPCADCAGSGIDRAATNDPQNPVVCETCDGDGISRTTVAAPSQPAAASPAPVNVVAVQPTSGGPGGVSARSIPPGVDVVAIATAAAVKAVQAALNEMEPPANT